MKNLNPPIDLDHHLEIDNIIAAKTKKIVKDELEILKPHIHDRFKKYIAEFDSNNLISIPDSVHVGNKSLISCYSSGGVKIAAIKKAITDLQDEFSNEKCMYCQIKEADSFDHYLPKDSYPEYSALALNLLPCCITCNMKKDEYWKEFGEIEIINFYLNSLPNVQFLFVNINSNSQDRTPLVSFEIKNVSHIDSDLFKIIQKHYKRLELIDRYNECGRKEISECRRTLKSYGKNSSIEDNMKSNMEYAIQLKNDFGENYWKSVFYEEISKHEEIIIQLK